MERVALIVNGAAGSSGEAEGEQIREAFGRRGIEAVLTLTEPDELGQAVVDACASGVDAVVIAGGDGSVSAAAAGAVAHDIVLGVLPCGTLNHFAKDLGVPVGDLDAAVEWLASAQEARVDVGEVNGTIFVNNASIGAYPRMVTFRNRIQEQRGWGKVRATVPAIIRTVRRLTVYRLRVSVEDQPARTVRTPFLFVGNGLFDRHGSKVGRRESLTDHRLGVYTIETDRVWRLVLDALITRLRGVHAAANAHRRSVPSLTVEFDGGPIAIALDGEPMKMASPLEFRSRPGALRVLTGRPPSS